MTTNILWNGSKWAGEEPDSIEKLEAVLAEHTLMPSLAPFTAPSPKDPSLTRFFGNFVEVSHSFSIDTDDLALVQRLTALIKANVQTPGYTQARVEDERRRVIAAENAAHAAERWRR